MAQNYVLLERIELNASAASVTFSNIPQTGYTDLKIVMSVRSNLASVYDFVKAVFNTGTGTYSNKVLYGNGSSAGSNNQGAVVIAGGAVGTTATANTYSNAECYIPNYLGSSAKSVSTDSVIENNGTEGHDWLIASLCTDTAAINKIVLSPTTGTAFLQYSTFSLYGIAAVGTTPAVAPKADGGNVIATDGTYWYHAFLSNGTFTPQVGLSCDYLVVAGGGAGAADLGGGGGAGGYRTSIGGSPLTVTASTGYSVTVGAGGAGTSTSGVNSGKGTDSVFSTITSTGGGGGNGYNATATSVMDGGSGGGSGSGGINGTVSRYGSGNTPSVSPSQGNRGGSGTAGPSNPEYSGGGGGGAGAVGGNGSGTTGSIKGGAGGAGLNSASAWATATGTGASGYYAGGGGASSYQNGTTGNGAGGAGGGGGGAAGSTIVATAGTANTGGGGGAGSNLSAPYITGQAGGSGIVIIRYAV